jgi:site-specific DNA recombinase
VAAKASIIPIPAPIRCAIYTRKSTEEGLQQDFNTLDAQRESAECYIRSQPGWTALESHYDDGGFTGANMERPALKKLLEAIDAGEIGCIVVYKVDRLTRSIRDLMELLTRLDGKKVTLVSVTESFNTTTPAGRMTLNLLLTFAQYEREMTAERTRDKMHAARRKGKWIGGNLILGYDVVPQGGAIAVNAHEADRVRQIFQTYLDLGSLIPVVEELERRDWRMKAWTTREGVARGGARFNKTTLHKLLTNMTYTGRVRFDGQIYAGEHEAIVTDQVWNAVQERLNRNGRRGGRSCGNRHNGLLKGLVRCGCGAGMTHSYTKKKETLYRYYVCVNAMKRGWGECPTRSVSAPELENAVVEQIRGCARHPAVFSEVLSQLGGQGIDPGELKAALANFDPLWGHLNTWERETFIRSMLSAVTYDGPTQMVTVTFHSEGIKAFCEGREVNV